VATETTELAGLATRVANYLHEVETASHAQPTVDVDLARQVGRSLIELLDGRHYDATQRALLRGAVEYFVLDDDEQSDLDDVVGFDDDARVFNAVAAALGRDDLVVQPG
ncbi:MAG: hypothetical protein OEY23_24415, partial [Acidimicrobiia bacterium]|nr:hypothetical protein [Acidimicrobiia bacterium]